MLGKKHYLIIFIFVAAIVIGLAVFQNQLSFEQTDDYFILFPDSGPIANYDDLGSDYGYIDEQTGDDYTGHYLLYSGDGEWQTSIFGLDHLPSGDFIITSVSVRPVCSDKSGGSARAVLYMDGQVFYGNTVTLMENPLTIEHTWALNPVTNSDWTTDDINSLGAGVSIRDSSEPNAIWYHLSVWVSYEFNPLHTVQVFTVPENCTVDIDGMIRVSDYGPAVFEDITDGSHVLSVMKNGFVTHFETIDVYGNMDLTVVLEPEGNGGNDDNGGNESPGFELLTFFVCAGIVSWIMIHRKKH